MISVKSIGIYGKVSLLTIVFNAHGYLKANFNYLSENVQYPDEVKEVFDIWRRAFDKKGKVLLGDCDEFMLQMIYILWSCKVPNKLLYLSVGHAYTGEGHAIPHVNVEGTLWQCDNMLKEPVPTYYCFNGIGYFVSKYSNGLFNLERKRWKKFKPSKISKPCEMKR